MQEILPVSCSFGRARRMTVGSKRLTRRLFLGSIGALASVTLGSKSVGRKAEKLRISLAQWSLHRAIQSGLISNLDFPRVAREQFGIEGLEFVNFLWESPTHGYLQQLKRNVSETGTKALVLWVGGERPMGHSEQTERRKAVHDHYKWVDIAAELGCHSIQANMETDLEPKDSIEMEAFVGRCVESFTELCEYARPRNINILTENHSNTASMPHTIVQLMLKARLPNLGTLPDFGNFTEGIDKYQAVRSLMPYARAVSFKCYDFEPDGEETTIDMGRMMKIVSEAGYAGWIGIEYEGNRLTEFEGVQVAANYLRRYTGSTV